MNETNDRPGFYNYNGTGNSSILMDFIPNTMYSISGYLTDTSSNPLIGAIVQTNTSQTTTTNSTGYYIFPSLANGTYNITATLYGYDSGYTIQTVNGAEIPNANFSLVTQPTYLLSGYVTNQSSGAPISGATVTTNMGQTDITDGTGYYNFALVDGTYLITASNTSYGDNSTTKTVNGAAVDNANISLLLLPPGKILVATNRYVILDDWKVNSKSGPGFFRPIIDHTPNSWTNKNTTINATALFIDDKGSPYTGRVITFNLYLPNGTEYTSARTDATTNEYGLANFSFNMDSMNYYGAWTVKASNSGIKSNTNFIYNWWGCGKAVGCDGGHSTGTPSRTRPANSPYYTGREVPSTSNHNNPNAFNCTDCHQSYDSKPGDPYSYNNSNNTKYASDVHKSLTCDNANCHQTFADHFNCAGVKG